MAIDIDELHRIALEYIGTPGLTMLALAEKNGYSKATVVRALKGDFKIKLPTDLQSQVDSVKRQRWFDGKATSGHTGHKKISDDMSKKLAQEMVEEGSTLEKLGVAAGVSKATIYSNFTPEILGDDLHDLVVEQYATNKRTRSGRK